MPWRCAYAVFRRNENFPEKSPRDERSARAWVGLFPQVLNDDEMRSRYDQFGEAGVRMGGGGGPAYEVGQLRA